MTALPLAQMVLAQVNLVFSLAADLVMVGVYSRGSVGVLAENVEFIPSPLSSSELANGWLHPGDLKLTVKASTLGGHSFRMDGGDLLAASLSGGGTATYVVVGGALDATGAYWTVYGRLS